MMDKYVKRDQDDYTEALANLRPQGAAWPQDPDSVQMKIINGLAGTWGNEVSDTADLFLVTESFPPYAVLLLPEWEKSFGLPDNCLSNPPTDISLRHANIVHRMTLEGGQSRAFYIGEAAYMGFDVLITERSPYTCGISQVGDTRSPAVNADDPSHFRWELGPPEIRYWWTTHIPPTKLFTSPDLECIFNRYKPSHTVVTFDFSLFNLQAYPIAFALRATISKPLLNPRLLHATNLVANASSLGTPTAH